MESGDVAAAIPYRLEVLYIARTLKSKGTTMTRFDATLIEFCNSSTTSSPSFAVLLARGEILARSLVLGVWIGRLGVGGSGSGSGSRVGGEGDSSLALAGIGALTRGSIRRGAPACAANNPRRFPASRTRSRWG
jgi:hypothetical protein